tara:strand:- start:12803 stop:14521 length:1719 start_codon:yes stop_codon:yes gene_type:complete
MKLTRPIVHRQISEEFVFENLTDLDPFLVSLFALRGLRSTSELNYSLSNLAPVSSFANIDEAASLVISHRKEKIVVVGDFDVDGATSIALLIRCLSDFGFQDVEYFTPDRFKYGYGLSTEIVDIVAKKTPRLLITVDNGISSFDGVSRANELGIPVLVTDHHLPGKELPAATAILNPNLKGNEFLSQNLAGVGVTFYLMARIGRMLEDDEQRDLAKIPTKYLDLVALGTIADVVPLDHNNRILVEQGLKRIRAGHAIMGIKALLKHANCEVSRCVSSNLAFAVGPRINATGRLDDMSVGIECLLTDCPETADNCADILNKINLERRNIESMMKDQAFKYVENINKNDLPDCICIYEQSWHQGIVGLIAARVKEKYHRPVIAFAREGGDTLKGSARSVNGINIRDLLEAVSKSKPGLIKKFGGHAMAAGLTLTESSFKCFKKIIVEQMQYLYPNADLSGAILIDGQLPASLLNLNFARSLRTAGPWGTSFPEPIWSGDFIVLEQRIVGEKHLKLRVESMDSKNIIEAIAFNQASEELHKKVQLIFRLDVNKFRNIESPQLIVEKIISLHEEVT